MDHYTKKLRHIIFIKVVPVLRLSLDQIPLGRLELLVNLMMTLICFKNGKCGILQRMTLIRVR